MQPFIDQPHSDLFRAAFRTHPAGVALITALVEGAACGFTASSVASVSSDPQVLSFSIARRDGSAGAIVRASTFIVHLMAADQAEIAREFAQPGGGSGAAAAWCDRLDTGEPVLRNARAAFRCRPLHVVSMGPAAFIVAEVLAIATGEQRDPLLYHDRQFRQVGDVVSGDR